MTLCNTLFTSSINLDIHSINLDYFSEILRQNLTSVEEGDLSQPHAPAAHPRQERALLPWVRVYALWSRVEGVEFRVQG